MFGIKGKKAFIKRFKQKNLHFFYMPSNHKHNLMKRDARSKQKLRKFRKLNFNSKIYKT